MKFKISFGIFLVIVSAYISHGYLFSQTPLWEVPQMLSNMRSKEFCSCLFVLDRDEKMCLDDVKLGYPIFDYKIDRVKKTIEFKNPFASSHAHYKEKFGCLVQ